MGSDMAETIAYAGQVGTFASSSDLRSPSCWQFFASYSGRTTSALFTRVITCTIGRWTRPCDAVPEATLLARETTIGARSILTTAPMASTTGKPDGRRRRSSGAALSMARGVDKMPKCHLPRTTAQLQGTIG